MKTLSKLIEYFYIYIFVDSLKTANRIGTPVELARGSILPKNKYQNLGCQIHRTWSTCIKVASNKLDILTVPSVLVGSYGWQHLLLCGLKSSSLSGRVYVLTNLILTLRRVQVGLIMFKLGIVYLQICQPLVVLVGSAQPLPSCTTQLHYWVSACGRRTALLDLT